MEKKSVSTSVIATPSTSKVIQTPLKVIQSSNPLKSVAKEPAKVENPQLKKVIPTKKMEKEVTDMQVQLFKKQMVVFEKQLEFFARQNALAEKQEAVLDEQKKLISVQMAYFKSKITDEQPASSESFI